MPLGDAAALVVHGQGQHVPVVVQILPQQGVDLLDHLPVADVPGRPVGGEEGVQPVDLVMGHRLDGHIADAHLIGVVGAAALEPGPGHGGAALHADGHRDVHQLGGLQELPGAGDGVVVDDPGGAEPLHAGGVDRGGGGVGREGIGGVDVVVDVLRDHGRELGGLQNLLQIFQPLRFLAGVQLLENGNVDHGGYLSSASPDRR